MAIKDYKDLIVWQKSMDLVVEIYRLIKKLPKEEIYGISDQMRRSAVSIPSNIAEGYNRVSVKEYVRFLYMIKGSRAELETQIFICIRLGYLTESDCEIALNLLTEISKMLTSIIQKITY